MRRGISHRQRQILGLAVGLSRIRRGYWSEVTGTEITTAFVAVGWCAFGPDPRWVDGPRPISCLARGSDRAFAALVERGLMTRCRPPTFDPRWGHRGKLRGGNYEGSYALTEAGRAAGLPHEITVTDNMRQIIELLDGGRWRYRRWWLPEERPRSSCLRNSTLDLRPVHEPLG